MKKITTKLFVAAMAVSALTACSDSTFTEMESGVLEPASGAPTVNSAVLTDGNGQQVSTLSSEFGTYYLDIKTDGLWYIETPQNMEFMPTKMYGQGSARVPVYIGNNWAESRQLSYNVKFLDENGQQLTRAGETEQTVTQSSTNDLAAFKQIVNSNIFVGYGYNPSKNIVPELCTGIQIFKMEAINDIDTLVKSTLSPQAKEVYTMAHSDSVVDKILCVSGHVGGNFNVVKLGLSGDVKKYDISHTGKTVIQKSLTRSVYSRELAWDKAWLNPSNLSTGFLYYKNRYIKQLKDAGNDEAKKRAVADEFFRIVGTHFITKSMLGCELNYRMEVDSSKTTNSLSVKGALDFKWQQQIKDTAGVDSATKAKIMELQKDTSKLKNFVFGGKVQYTDSVFKASSSTTARVKARGGNVELVNILTTGGSLYCDDLAKWLLGTEAAKATMTGVTIQPIYDIFDDTDVNSDEGKARAYLKQIIDANFSLDPTHYGNIPTLE